MVASLDRRESRQTEDRLFNSKTLSACEISECAAQVQCTIDTDKRVSVPHGEIEGSYIMTPLAVWRLEVGVGACV